MPTVFLPDLRLSYQDDGPKDGPAVVLLHALGLDGGLFDPILPLLPTGLRLIRPDMRGHGRSDVPDPPYAMGALVRDVERLMEHLAVKEAVVLGLSIGGMIAQGLAVKRLDLVRGLILSNTAARIGIAPHWDARIEAVRTGGMAAIADATVERWFGRSFRLAGGAEPFRQRLLACDPRGWTGGAAAIAGTDFYTPTATLTLPALAIAGADDGSTPPDLVRETAELILGADFCLIRGAGHLPFVEKPAEYAAAVTGFLTRIAHV
ncbi:3-oxoadipate enol-lactonase [Aliigemmobacter aestuarii]|uniref:3-oxoadipate enol-lactonase n=1 Tax=Aliigemmobacter aestuarii TaxID=1445661 RepID=A0A4S3MJD8_9RHOB|nr:3-oxoadipate enol-lactonase [Gemmobacter aestuarii]THD81545.1 3-oxoadipate enol-lactonase [Gemmobacter aestuarii]